MRKPWVWNEIEVWTGKDLMEILQLLTEQDEADDFIESYAEVCEDEDHALHNVRYMLAIVPQEDAKRLAELFGVDLPAKDETISPRQWFATSSCGIMVAA